MNPARSFVLALIVVATVLPAPALAGQKASPPDLQAQLNALAARVSSLEGQVSTLRTTVSTQAAQITALQTDLGAIQKSNLMALNDYLKVTTDMRGPLLTFSGVNVQLVNGAKSTNAINGLGNLILGYDLARVMRDVVDSVDIWLLRSRDRFRNPRRGDPELPRRVVNEGRC